MNVIVVLSTLENTVRLPLITACCLIPTVTMEAVWMILVPSSVSVTQDTLETSVILTLMNVKQLDARMGNVKTSLMHFSVLAILDGLEFSVMQTSMTVQWPDLDHVTTKELEPVLMVTPRTHVSV